MANLCRIRRCIQSLHWLNEAAVRRPALAEHIEFVAILIWRYGVKYLVDVMELSGLVNLEAFIYHTLAQ